MNNDRDYEVIQFITHAELDETTIMWMSEYASFVEKIKYKTLYCFIRINMAIETWSSVVDPDKSKRRENVGI